MANLGRVFSISLAAAGLALGQNGFKVGEKVEKEYAASWYAGTVTVVGTGKDAGWYKVRDNGTGNEAWADGRRMRALGQKLSTPFTLEAKDTFGSWGLGAVTTTTRETSDKVYRDTVGSSAGGSLTINADGTYAWKIAGGVITGKWRSEPRPERYRGPVLMEKGWMGRSWWVNYEGHGEAGNESIYIRSDAGTTFSGFRYK
jgi:hypothetical protein